MEALKISNIFNKEYCDIFTQSESKVFDIDMFNDSVSIFNNIILYLNIRSLNANFCNLEILMESLKVKPLIIICTETFNLQFYDYF